MSDVQTIGVFQLENLISQRLQFGFFSLNPTPADLNSKLFQAGLLAKADAIATEKVESICALLGEKVGVKEQPVVLVCQTGELSLQVAQALAPLGYKNTVVLSGGWTQLEPG